MTERKRIGLRDATALKSNEQIWDATVTGFYARRRTGTAVTFGVVYRTVGSRRWRRQTIGRLGAPWTPETARKEAQRILGEVARGHDPQADKLALRKATTVSELCNLYVADAKAGRILGRGGRAKKESTIAFDEGAIRAHIAPLLGSKTVVSVTKADIERFMHAVAEGKTASIRKTKPRGVSRISGGRGIASRVVGLLGGVFSYARDHGMRDDNPCARLRKFAENPRERRLSDDEYAALSTGLDRASEGRTWPPAIGCLKFLALTGWRSGEGLNLRWRDIDLARRVAFLSDTKTGRSIRPLSYAACDVLRSMTRLGDGALVFPASRGDGIMSGFKRHAAKMIDAAGLPDDTTPHVLRHSFASIANDLGLSEATIAMLIGHKGRSTTTGRYVHGADAVLLAAADQVAGRIAELMGETRGSDKVIELRAEPHA